MRNRIRIARGDISSASNDIKAEEGVPFYDTTHKRLYIGKDSTTPINQYTKNESPVAFESDHAQDADKSYRSSHPVMFGSNQYSVSTFNSNISTAYSQLSQGIISQREYDDLVNGYINNLLAGSVNPIAFDASNNSLNVYGLANGSIKKFYPVEIITQSSQATDPNVIYLLEI